MRWNGIHCSTNLGITTICHFALFSVLYFSIHRYDHGCFWPEKKYSDFDFVGKEGGEGFNINVAWNKVL